jgi:hypothetical protein
MPISTENYLSAPHADGTFSKRGDSCSKMQNPSNKPSTNSIFHQDTGFNLPNVFSGNDIMLQNKPFACGATKLSQVKAMRTEHCAVQSNNP